MGKQLKGGFFINSKRKLILACMLLVLVLGVGASFAADSNQTDLQASDDTDAVVSISETDTVSSNDNNTVISVNENSGETLGATTGTFTELQSLVNSNYGKTLTLTQDYAYNANFGTTGIQITSAITIDGQGIYTLDGKSASRIMTISGANVIIKNVKFVNGAYSTEGGAIRWGGNYGTLTGCTFQNNKVTGQGDGGAVNWFGLYGEVSYCNFTKNYANVPSGDAGGLAYWAGHGIIKNCRFEGNQARPSVGGGGALVWMGYNRTISDCVFINNYVTTNGGGLMLGGGSDNYVIRCTFINNRADNNGGALYLYQDSSYSAVIECTFINNTAGNEGGAIQFDASNFNITDSEFINNKATNNGGAIASNAQDSLVIDCVFENNDAQDGQNFYATTIENTIEITSTSFDLLYISNNGAGEGLRSDDPTNWDYAISKIKETGTIYFTSGTYTALVNCIIDKPVKLIGLNTVTVNANNGGRIFTINANNVEIQNIKFTKGKADKGGAILWNGDYGTLTGSTFESNAATNNGGALYLAGSNFVGTSNTFKSNTATNNGGAVYVEGNNNVFGSSTFTSNSAKIGGAIYNVGDAMVITKSTFITNSASTSHNDIYSSKTFVQTDQLYQGSLTVNAEDTVYGNSAVISGKLSAYSAGATIDLLLNGVKLTAVTIQSDGSFSYTWNNPSAGFYTITLAGSDSNNHAYLYNNYKPKTFYVYNADSFYALQKLINTASSSLTLTRNYNYYEAYDSKNGVRINKVFTLNGGGFTIDGKNAARLIEVTNYEVNIQNIKLINANYDGNGGAILWNGTSGKLSYATFSNNNANNYRNVYSAKDDLQITNSVFTNIVQTITPTSTSINYGNDFGVTASFDDGTNLNTNILALTGNGISLGTTTNGNSISYTYSKPLPNTYTLTFAGSDNNGNTYIYSNPSSAQVTVNRASTIYVSPTNKGLGLTEATTTIWDNVANLLTNDGTVIFTGGTYSDFYGKTISQGWTLQAASGATPVLDANNKGRIFTVSANNVKINGLTFKNGNATDSYGSAIHWTGTGGTLTNSVLTQNIVRPVTATNILTMTNNQLKDQITLTKSNIDWAGTETITGTFAHNAPSTVTIKFNDVAQGTYNVASSKVTQSYAFTDPSTRSVGSYVVTGPKNIYKEVL